MTFYIPRHFRVDDPATLEAFMARHAFATLASADADGRPAVTHLPLIARRDDDGRLVLEGHVARANPHWEGFAAAPEVVAIFEGPHGYVSPRWYADPLLVPTWNYAVVHARGKARLLPSEALPGLLARLSAAFESGADAPWTPERLPEAHAARLHGAIVGFEIAVERLEGKFKLSQNRSAADVASAAEALEEAGLGELAGLMRAPPGRAGESR
jgi:transcriptional regulator